MPTLIICQDAPDAPTLRKTYLQPHFDYITSIIDQVSIAGPLKTPQEGAGFETTLRLQAQSSTPINGSCFIYTTDDFAVAKELFFNDPYYVNGVYQSYTVSAFTAAAGEWIGGTVW